MTFIDLPAASSHRGDHSRSRSIHEDMTGRLGDSDTTSKAAITATDLSTDTAGGPARISRGTGTITSSPAIDAQDLRINSVRASLHQEAQEFLRPN
jgi:hypothetical protein